MRLRKARSGFECELIGWPSLFVHWGTIAIPIALTATLWSPFRTNGMLTALIVIPACVLSILAHELAHAIAARRYGLDAVAIRLLPMGGEAVIAGEPTRREDRVITFAGPLANLAIGLICLCAYAALGPLLAQTPIDRYDTPPPVTHPFYIRSLLWIGWINVALGVINMLPAYPLDGGKLADSFVSQWLTPDIAQFWVGVTGVGLAAVSTLVLLGTLVAGAPVWSPPSFEPNLRAIFDTRWRPWRRSAATAQPTPSQTGRDADEWLEALRRRAGTDAPDTPKSKN